MSSSKFAMTFVMLSIFVAMVAIAWEYPPQARFMPLVIGIPAIVLCVLQLYIDFRQSRLARESRPEDARSEMEKAQEEISRLAGRKIRYEFPAATPAPADTAPAGAVRRELAMWGYFLALVGGVLVFGFTLFIPVFLVVFLRQWAKTSWRFALGLTVVASTVLYLVFVQGLGIVPHPGLLTEYVLERFAS